MVIGITTRDSRKLHEYIDLEEKLPVSLGSQGNLICFLKRAIVTWNDLSGNANIYMYMK